ncbi:hypothetical protein LP419_21525 [Massilia sp. H-1]|nr:hypothetical protein LP419_21525 [Massilia sp. H-1]
MDPARRDLSLGRPDLRRQRGHARVLTPPHEKPELKTTVRIANSTEGLRNNWAYQLASRINAEQPLLHAGQMGTDGAITPVYGQNTIYAKTASTLTRVEVQVNKVTLPCRHGPTSASPAWPPPT